MKNKNFMILLLMTLLSSVSLFAQDDAPILGEEAPQNTSNLPVVETDPDAQNVGEPRVADEKITTVLLDNFDIPQGWLPNIPLDFGISKILYREGGPKEIAADDNKVVLGVKTVFFRRNFGWMNIDRPYPLTLNSLVRAFSVWVSGRNKRFNFFIKVRDLDNNRMRLPGGEMRFQGWKKLTMPVSDSVIQYRASYNRYGLDFLGFYISFTAEDISTGDPYYVYIDQLTASMNIASSQLADDIADDW